MKTIHSVLLISALALSASWTRAQTAVGAWAQSVQRIILAALAVFSSAGNSPAKTLLAAFVLVTTVHPAFTQISATPKVWVLHDEDPNYSLPTTGDTLTALGQAGERLAQTAGINICQTIGAWRALAVTDAGRGAIVCEFCGPDRLSKFDLNGNQVCDLLPEN